MGRNIDLNLLKSLEDIQNSKKINHKLLLASLYLTSFEILKSSIIDQLHDFFQIGYNKDRGKVYDPQYKAEVLSLVREGKDKLSASSLWLLKMEAITKDDLEYIAVVRKHRNEIAHELHEIVFYHERNIRIDLIKVIRELVYKIDGWWLRYVEIPINNIISQTRVSEEGEAISGPAIILDLIINNVLKDIEK